MPRNKSCQLLVSKLASLACDCADNTGLHAEELDCQLLVSKLASSAFDCADNTGLHAEELELSTAC
jgi:hypothetical protein